MILSIVILGLSSLILVTITFYYWSYKRKYGDFPSQSIIKGLIYTYLTGRVPKNIPFTSVIFQEVISIGQKFRKEGLCFFWFFGPSLLIYGEEAIKIFTNEPAALDHSDMRRVLEIAFGKGLLTSNGERWKLHRKMINPVFHVGMLRSKMPIFNENAKMLLQKLGETEGKPTSDIHFLLRWCFINSLGESVLGIQMTKDNEDKMRRIADLITRLSEFMIDKMCYPFYNWRLTMHLFPRVREHLKYLDELKIFGKELLDGMKQRVLSREVTGDATDESNAKVFAKRPKSLAETLLEMHLKDPSFTMNDVQDQVNTFLVAGFDTVSYTMMWCLFFWGLHPDIQEQAYNEVTRIEKDDIAYDDLSKLPYLDAVIKETLRLHPTVPIYARYLNKNVQCDKYCVPKGTNILIFAYMWHRDPELYPNPEIFDPSRFFEKNLGKKPWSLIPFSEGIRNCIGKNYAMTIMKVFLAHILRSFKVITLDRREDVILSWQILMASVRPLNMQFLPRQSRMQPTA